MSLNRFYYHSDISDFVTARPAEIVGQLAINSEFSVETTQKDAWLAQIDILQKVLAGREGSVYFEYSIPRMGKRIDAVVIIGAVIFVLEFKVGEDEFAAYAIDQVWDYALDLKNFHETSHDCYIVPVLISTQAKIGRFNIACGVHDDKVLLPIKSDNESLSDIIEKVLVFCDAAKINANHWEQGRYLPTPTIVEAATALYRQHSVDNILRKDASRKNLAKTSRAISKVINFSQANKRKSICFVTGVPGAGKTLVGLDIATKHINKDNALYSVFLSGNGPLVEVLREALTRDKVEQEKKKKKKIKKGDAAREVKLFIQNVHNFRDECLKDLAKPPLEHVALFDEAQRAWNLGKTIDFMQRKKKVAGFKQSEPEFLISCLDRHKNWAVVVCLVGAGQEIYSGEAGISEWIEALNRSFPKWDIYISPKMTDSEYSANEVLEKIKHRAHVKENSDLHLAVSMRSFRAESVSLLVKQVLDLEAQKARQTLAGVNAKYPIVLTRSVESAKKWLKAHARGTERYGMVVSSQAQRLRPLAIDIRVDIEPIHWFLNDKTDVRSSYYLEDVATEFQVQGLELDWACVVWDGDFRYTSDGWRYREFRGNKWQNINKEERRHYLKNSYRVLLTRARQGMVIVVPEGDKDDPTRNPEFYNSTFEYLKSIGFKII